MKKESDIFQKTITPFLHMDIEGTVINCPYWSNRIENGMVTVRGFEEGKGTPEAIRNKITDVVNAYKKEKPEAKIDPDTISYLSLQNRIGIDCSGFVFRIIESIIGKKDKELMFPRGARGTNADMLTRNSFSHFVRKVSEIVPGDLVRVSSGHHVVIITSVGDKTITYAHSSSHTLIRGVHTGEITIKDPREEIEDQIWLEETLQHQNWKERYFHKTEGDGVYRNEIINKTLKNI